MTDELRDIRKPGWFWAKNDIIDRDGSELGAYGIAVYCVLAKGAGEKSKTWPSVGTIAKTLGCSENTVRTAIKKLQDLGWIEKETRTTESEDGKKRYSSNMYYLLEPPSGDEVPPLQEMKYPTSPDEDKEDKVNKTKKTKSERPKNFLFEESFLLIYGYAYNDPQAGNEKARQGKAGRVNRFVKGLKDRGYTDPAEVKAVREAHDEAIRQKSDLSRITSIETLVQNIDQLRMKNRKVESDPEQSAPVTEMGSASLADLMNQEGAE